MLYVDRIAVKVARKGPVLLREVSFSVAPGTFLAVLGPNGTGKTTLLKAIGGELPLRTGSIRWKKRKIQDLDLEEIAQERAFLDQDSAVPFAFTAREVVMMGRYPYYGNVPSAADEAAVDRAIVAMRAEHFQHRAMPTLSGGERQRAHIARVMAQLDNDRTGASLLLLDEPLNDLDIKHQHALLSLARQRAEAGHCVIAVLHDVNLAAQYAHHIALLKEGHIVDHGPTDEVLTADRLSFTYGMPAQLVRHPILDTPWVHFGEAADTPLFDTTKELHTASN